MNPIAFAVITFGIWLVVRGQAAQYWALATTANPSGSVLSPPSAAGASQASGGIGSPNPANAPLAAFSPFAQAFAQPVSP